MEESEDTQSSAPSRLSQMSSPPASPPEKYSENETGDPPVKKAALVPEMEDVQQGRGRIVSVQKLKSVGTGGGNAGSGGREDCWSEGATSVLIEAWGQRFLELTRGNLKQKHWQEVAEVVSRREDHSKTAKTDVQCKNRIDTLKKKYKVEKSKITATRTSSDWPFFRRLDDLIGGNPHNKSKTNKKNPPKKRSKFELQLELKSCRKKKRSTMTHKQLSRKTTTKPVLESTVGKVPQTNRTVNGKRKRVSECTRPVSTGGGKEKRKGLSEVVKAVATIGEMYERVERAKLEQAAEMEKQRMMFAKELELQRMQFLLKTQLELTQIKYNNNNNGVNNKNTADDDRNYHHRRRRRRRECNNNDDDDGGSSNNYSNNSSNNNNNNNSNKV